MDALSRPIVRIWKWRYSGIAIKVLFRWQNESASLHICPSVYCHLSLLSQLTQSPAMINYHYLFYAANLQWGCIRSEMGRKHRVNHSEKSERLSSLIIMPFPPIFHKWSNPTPLLFKTGLSFEKTSRLKHFPWREQKWPNTVITVKFFSMRYFLYENKARFFLFMSK
jgi:hypothetical protein